VWEEEWGVVGGADRGVVLGPLRRTLLNGVLGSLMRPNGVKRGLGSLTRPRLNGVVGSLMRLRLNGGGGLINEASS